MPRTRTATADPSTTAGAAVNGTAGHDQEPLEELPEFGTPSPRPETCDNLSPWGTRCTFEVHSGLHSWQGEPVPGKTPHTDPESTENSTRQTDQLEQPALPGTPEPTVADLAPPVESQFNGGDFLEAPVLKDIAEGWINELDGLAHLRGIRIAYFWKRRGGLKGGNPRLGNLGKVTGLTKHALGRPVFALWIASDHVRDLKLAPDKVRAAVLHYLCGAEADPDDHDSFRIVGPDAEVYTLELQTVGLWSLDLREMAANVMQLGLLDSIDPAAIAQERADAEAEADEGEDE